MAGRRRKRFDTLLDKRALIEAMRGCRAEACRANGDLTPGCQTYEEIHLLTAAIDRLAEHLTGDRTLFHASGTSGPSGMMNGVVVGRRD